MTTLSEKVLEVSENLGGMALALAANDITPHDILSISDQLEEQVNTLRGVVMLSFD